MTTLPTNPDHPCYHDDTAARVMFEAIRWPYGPICPHCGKTETVSELGGESMGPGWFHCSECREKFTVRVGSVLERSAISPCTSGCSASGSMADQRSVSRRIN